MIIVKRWMTSMFAVGCLLLEPEVMASEEDRLMPVAKVAAEKSYSLLFSLKSNYAKLVHMDGNNYQLLIPISEIKPVLAFTDRPYRLARRLTPDEFAHLVHQGENSFSVKPPNIVVTFDAEQPVANAFEVVSYQKDSEFIQYNIRYLNDSEGLPDPDEGAVTIFIDEFMGRLPA